MPVDLGTTPEEFASNFFTSYAKEVIFGGGDPARNIDRFYTPDFVQVTDGTETDRAALAAHAPAASQTFESVQYTVHEALRSGDTLAVRLTFEGSLKAGGTIQMEYYTFAELAADRRFQRVSQITRTLKNDMTPAT
ncbi:nuclear transport factor 2 family protein [Streptomyces kanamyceticus]|uniref:Nuclear transport factor 2 family protein n=1 Tax=Streptomyces kanamyceticus TaxID=1967 RepID=A0A5J6G619_STRKN|nr:nuclear transport factor 2 family protein [Streptomyces kanamyceticus]QEU90413.1 nuclear transport factor 2 family protein [Streptomyces kanamyceticus]